VKGDFFAESANLIRAEIFRRRSIVAPFEAMTRDAKLNENSKSKRRAQRKTVSATPSPRRTTDAPPTVGRHRNAHAATFTAA
jgi:hypothetical protein